MIMMTHICSISELQPAAIQRLLNGDGCSSGRIDIIQELDQEDELSCFHPIEVWKAIDLFIRIKEKEEAARESGSTTLSQSRLKKLAAFQMPAPLPLKI